MLLISLSDTSYTLSALAIISYDIVKLFEKLKNHKRRETRKSRLVPDMAIGG